MKIDINAKFTGLEADEHLLPAYEAGQSLQGIARSLVIASHYAATGEVRHRIPYESNLKIYIKPPRKGSWEAIFQIISDPSSSFLIGIGAGITANIINDFLKFVNSNGLGIRSKPETQKIREISQEI